MPVQSRRWQVCETETGRASSRTPALSFCLVGLHIPVAAPGSGPWQCSVDHPLCSGAARPVSRPAAPPALL